MAPVTDDDPRSDGALVRAANRGEVEAFEALYFRYRDWVAGMALRITGSDADALDVLQETFTYLLGKFPGFRLRAKMTTFLYPVVRHLSLNALKARRRAAPGEGVMEELPAPDPPPSDYEGLVAVLSSLPAGQREVVLLRFVDDFSLKEIAEALSIPVGTVKSRLHKALKSLRDDPRARDYFLQ